MKRHLLLMVSLLFCMLVMAQDVPLGIKYQAVARDNKGQILQEKEISLRVSLKSEGNGNNDTPHYIEIHRVKTNLLGLFTVVLGEGTDRKGEFSKIPWSSEDIWMEIAISERGNSNFMLVSNSRLLAVPYAFHAATASQLVGGITQAGEGSPSNNWITFGNVGTDPALDRLGTNDNVDLVIITNNIERLRILANGDVNLANTLNIGKDLRVKENVFLNETAGSTINYGPFTVERKSPTLLSGTLTVDLATDLNASLNVDGITNLNSQLNVNYMSPSKLSGTLTVDGITNLNNALNVNNMSPTLLTGTLRVDKDALFKEKVLLDNASHQSTSVTTGALVVNGGFGLGGNLNVGGDAKFGGATSFAGAVTISDGTESTSTTTGALKVTGGVGIGKRLNVGGATLLGNTLGVTGATTLSSTLAVAGAASLNNTLSVAEATTLAKTLGVGGIASFNDETQSSSTANGALIVKGGAGVAKNLNVGGNLTVTGATNMNGGLAVSKSAAGADVATFENTANGNGMSIKVGVATPANANNFISFKNSAGTVVGRVEGETLAEIVNSTDYKNAITNFDLTIATATVNLAAAAVDVGVAVAGVVSAATSVTLCTGLGICVTTPVPSLIVQAAVVLAARIANLATYSIGLYQAIDAKNSYITSRTDPANRGVTYASGAGDYAEWLPKASLSEKFLPGSVVGVNNGMITLNTAEASQLMVISTKPFMLGNMPEPGNEARYEKVAFMGQVPVLVAGPVNVGDYIIPSGLNNGVGFAKAPKDMEVDDYAKVVGVAWSSNAEIFGKVNVAIGINHNDLANAVKKQENIIKEQNNKIASLEQQMTETKDMVAHFMESMRNPNAKNADRSFADNKGAKDDRFQLPPAMRNNGAAPQDAPEANRNITNLKPLTEDDIHYFPVTREEVELGFKQAQALYDQAEVKLPAEMDFWKKFNEDAGYRNSILTATQNKLTNAFHWHKETNHKLIK